MKKTWNDVKTWEDVRLELKVLLKSDEQSAFEIFKQAGLSRNAYYKIFESGRESTIIRKSTINRLAIALNLPCAFYDGLPYFGALEASHQTRNGSTVKEVIQLAVDIARTPKLLSENTHVQLEEITNILGSDNPVGIMSLKSFSKIAKAIGLTLSIFRDNSFALIANNGEIPKLDSYVPSEGIISLSQVDEHSISFVSDFGLYQLLNPNNLKKHSITEQEIEELTYIHESRNSKGNLSQWIAILYAIRGLNISENEMDHS
jgi:transcriptional regulator with XRE-family HTH domain